MIKSTDGGATWLSPVLINDDQSFNQYHPWCTVDQSTGQLLFVWYDSRNTGNDSTSVWMASSFDGGEKFNNFEVSEEPFKPKPISGLAGGYQGDYIGIAALNDVAYPYWADDRTGNYQGWMSVVNFDPPIPVELTSFAAVIVADNVQLNWSTATEINNQGFEIQRRTSDGEFEKVGFVPAHGTTTDVQTYSYLDSKVVIGNYTYRLKQIDFNGTFEYSDEVAVEITAPVEFTLEQNYPNPFNPSTVIKYSIPENGFVTLVVYNLLGEKVASLLNGLQDAGRYEINFDASNLASGIYVYNLKSGNFNSVKKMLLMK